MPDSAVRFGADRWSEVARLLRGRVVGVLTHPAAVDLDLRMTVVKALATPEFRVDRLFAAEHGFWGTHQDQERIRDTSDPWLERPVYSLYQEGRLRPEPEHIQGLQGLLFDMQDIGTRYYTFFATLAGVMEALNGTDIRLVVLDRPNPLNGVTVEGPLLEERLRSLVGIHPVPVRHGLTMGELACLYRSERGLDVDLQVVPLEGWPRSAYWDDLGRPWLAPSPNMPDLETALVYPGMCLLEATNVSEGRGTTRPFLWFGAPWIDPIAFTDHLNALHLEGVLFKPQVFRPLYHKYAGQVCGGARIVITDRYRFEPFWTGVMILHTLKQLYPQDFAWRREPYEFVADIPALDLLCGTSLVREALDQGRDLAWFHEVWRESATAWQQRVENLWLYPRPNQS